MAKKPLQFEDLILHEDEQILLVNKPAGMSSLDDKHGRNLQRMAQAYSPLLKLCHRLDKNTSGILLMAKGPEYYRDIALQFQHREVHKAYQTLVAGVHAFSGDVVDLPLQVSTNKRVTVNLQEGKPAITHLFTEENFRNYTRLRCEPLTGRTHQIRVHLAVIGCPIIGDTLYEGEDLYLSHFKRKYKPSGRKEEQPINHGFLLHAQQLGFRHPGSGEAVSFEAPFPKNFQVALKLLRKYNL